MLATTPAQAARESRDPLTRYARARMADVLGEPERALPAYAEALTASGSSAPVAYRTYREALEAGDKALALRAVRSLDRLDALPPDGPMLLYIDALQRGDWRGAEREVDRIESTDAFGFMVPAMRAWLLLGSRAPDPLAPFEARVGDALSYQIGREQRALVQLARGNAASGAELARDQSGQGIYRIQFALMAAARLYELKEPKLAAALLEGPEAEFARARAWQAAGQTLPDAVSRPAAGVSELMARVALLLLAERAPQSAAVLARFAQFADPKRPYPRLAGAVVFNAVGQPDRALALLEGLETHPVLRDWVAQTRFDVLRAAKRDEDALALAQSIAERPDAGPADLVRLGDARSAMKQPKEAAEAFAAAIARITKLHGETQVPWHYWLQYGRELEAAGDWPKARVALEKAVAKGPEQATALNHLGYSMLEHGEDANAATKLIERARAIRPDDAAITDSLGWAWVKRGDLAQGIPLLEEASQKEPGMGEISEHLGDAYWMAGRRIDARYAWNNALVQSDGADAQRLSGKIDFGLKAKK